MVFGNILQQLYSMVDTVIVGRYLGASALAGVGATGAISFLVVGFATGICTGLSIPVAQAFGAGDYHSMRKNIANSYYLGALIGVLLTILTMIGTGTILHWMKTPDDIYQYSYDYIIVIFGGILTSVLYNSLAAILRAVGDSKSPILFLAISSVLNIILDLVFLVGMQSGVAGAGYATVISQGISGILCLIYLYKKFHIMRFQHGECKPELKRCGRLLSIGLPMALQFSITAIGPSFCRPPSTAWGLWQLPASQRRRRSVPLSWDLWNLWVSPWRHSAVRTWVQKSSTASGTASVSVCMSPCATAPSASPFSGSWENTRRICSWIV